MDHYLEQLIDDLKRSAAQATAFRGDVEVNIPEETTIEAFGDPGLGVERRLSDIVGISRASLPAPGKLRTGQINRLLREMVDLLHAWNFHPEFPDHLPNEIRYDALRGIWDSRQPLMNDGIVHLEFCNYDPDDCPFPGYCDECDMMNSDIEADNTDAGHMFSDLPADDEHIASHFDQIEGDFYQQNGVTDPEGFIPGIHNYCDRWCEHCNFASRCRVFAMEKELREALDSKDEDRRAETLNKLFGDPDDPDLDDEDIEIEFEFDDEPEPERDDLFSSENKADRHPLWQRSDQWAWAVRDWIKQQRADIRRDFVRLVAGGFADEVINAQHVLEWYNLFIPVKFKRALTGYYEQDEFEEADYDMNGSAKIALIGVDRTLEAMQTLHRHLKSERETLRALRSELEQIRVMAEEQFPYARSFIRPGFDEL